jgi:DNA polymerase III subunit alpha
MFVPLHVKSDLSPGYGTASVESLVRQVAALGFPALALTDVENLYGQVRLHRAARAHGVRPITGVELRSGYGPHELGSKAGRLVLLARDRAGYESLCRIITRRRGTVGPSTGDPLGCLEAQPRGLFFLSDDASVIQALLRAGVDRADVRFLLVRPGGDAAPVGVRAVADPDVVMAAPCDRNLHVLRLAIRRGCTISEVSEAEPPERSLRAPAELEGLFEDAPDALAETLRVAEACALYLGESRPLIPSTGLGGDATADERLHRICRERLAEGRREGKWQASTYDERLGRELAVVRRLGFAGYFLIVGEIADRARRDGISVVGRGSAVGSMIAHVLGLTGVDPIEHGLFFERFIHPERQDLPDIDLDLPSSRRDEVIAWVFRHFGAERVAMVSAHQTFRRRAAFREGLKALGLHVAEIERFCRRLPAEELADEVAPPLPLHLLPDRGRRAVPVIERLIGTFQHVSVHPGGVVIAEPPIDRHTPLERAPKGVLVSQYDMHSLADTGLVKIDLLGNRALGAIEETSRRVGRPLAMPDGDLATIVTLREARTVGCFQVETPAVRAILRKLPVRGIHDLMAALALVRPGPAAGEAKAAYVRRAHGEEPAEPPHPRLAQRLRDALGMMLYEEDLMAAIAALTGWSLERADAMRAAIVSAQDDAAVASLGEAFRAASARTGVSPTEAAAVWQILARFAAYSFSKAHASSYARLAWQTAYLKTHHPVEFACAVLNSYGGHYPLRTVASDFTRVGVRLRPPHVNVSLMASSVDSGAVQIGLATVKRLTARTRALLLGARPFRDMRDLLSRAAIPHRELEALILCGACDGLAPLAPEAYPFAHQELLARVRAEGHAHALDTFVAPSVHGNRIEMYRSLVRIRNELAYLEMHLTDHPLRVLRDEATRAGCVATSELAAHRGRFARIAGVVAATRRLVTRGGQVMQFVTFEDEHGLVETVLFPGAYATLGDPVTDPGPFLVGGRVEEDHGDVQLRVSEVLPFHRRPRPYGKAEPA